MALRNVAKHLSRWDVIRLSTTCRAFRGAQADMIIYSGRPCHLWTLRGHAAEVHSVVWAPDGTRLASASDDKTVRVWDVVAGKVVHTMWGHTDWVRSVAWAEWGPDGRRLASASEDKTVRVWDVETGHVVHTLRGHTDWVFSVAWAPDGRRLASASDDQTVRVWDRATGHVIQSL